METPQAVGTTQDLRPTVRRCLMAAAALLAFAWAGVAVIAVVSYSLMARAGKVSVTWGLGRWDTWGFSGRLGGGTATMAVGGIWWILLPLLALVVGILAVYWRPNCTNG